MVGSSAWKSEQILFASPGTVVEIAGYEVRFDKVERVRGPNYVSDMGTLTAFKDGEQVALLQPERRWYPVAEMQTTESAIRSTLAGDLYVTIGEPAADRNSNEWTLRILFEPFVNFIWIGTMFLVIGGTISLTDRRLRVGVPKRTARPPIQATPAE
jgi:cytochrome c-type biogenesis protein CcmF